MTDRYRQKIENKQRTKTILSEKTNKPVMQKEGKGK